jgi:hypothetical protein
MSNIPIVNGPVIEDTRNWMEESYYDKYEILENGDAILTKRSGNKYLILYEETSDCTCPYYPSTSSRIDYSVQFHGPCFYCKIRHARKLFIEKK